MRETITTTITKDSASIYWSCMNLLREALGEDKLPHIMMAWKNSTTRVTPTGKPRVTLIPGVVPMIKKGSKARPPIFCVASILLDSEKRFYDYDWNLIDEEEYKKQMGAIDKNEFDYSDPNFIYNSYDKTYTVKGYKQ